MEWCYRDCADQCVNARILRGNCNCCENNSECECRHKCEFKCQCECECKKHPHKPPKEHCESEELTVQE